MKVYIVVNEALHPTSSYYDVEDVFKNFKDAQTALHTNELDFIKEVEKGNYKGFTFSNLDINEEEYFVEIKDKETDFFEKWSIEERIIK